MRRNRAAAVIRQMLMGSLSSQRGVLVADISNPASFACYSPLAFLLHTPEALLGRG